MEEQSEDRDLVTKASIETETTDTSPCEKINKALQGIYFNLDRAKLLTANEECIKLQDLLAFSSCRDHDSSACPMGEACPLLPGDQQESLHQLCTLLAQRSKEIQNVLEQCHGFSHSSENEASDGSTRSDVDDQGDATCKEVGGDDSGWVLGADMFGIKTYYQTHGVDGDGQLSLRMEGEQEVPVFEQMVNNSTCLLTY
jgi:hypothetical protein